MLMAPGPERRTSRRTAATRPAVVAPDITDEEEGAGFLAFMGQHSAFAASHRGA